MTSVTNKTVAFYDDCALHVKDNARAMGWSSAFSQRLRFEVITYLVDVSNQDVLDVGCGDGAFFHFLEEKSISLSYSGIDISSKMVQRAQNRYPGIPVRQGDFFNHNNQHDVVVCSGALSMSATEDKWLFLSQAIDQLMAISRTHVVFNLLSDRATIKDPLFHYYAPKDVLGLCLQKTDYVTLHHSYLPNDFTVHLVKL